MVGGRWFSTSTSPWGAHVLAFAVHACVNPRLPCAEWEYNNYRDGEVQEMVELYMARGFDEADAREVGAAPSRASCSTHSGTRALCLNTTPPPYFARP